MSSHEFDPLEIHKLSTAAIRDLKKQSLIKDGSPLWWNTDYAPDPREYLTSEEFLRRLIYLGTCKTNSGNPYRGAVQREVYLYPEPTVPMTVINLWVLGQVLPFLVTARPYHRKELSFEPYPLFLRSHPLETIHEYARSGGVIDLPNHFYPHIRGLFAGRRGSAFFWYPLHTNSFWDEFSKPIEEALTKVGLSFLYLYSPPFGDERRYTGVWEELLEKEGLVDQKKPAWFDFLITEVSFEEFLEEFYNTDKDLFFYYPLRIPGIEHTLPLVVATRTHKESKRRKPTVLGIYAENELHGYGWKAGILRIKNPQLARAISQLASEEFGFSIETVLFTPTARQT